MSIIVNDFSFLHEEDAKTAEKEKEIIKSIKDKLNMDDTAMLIKIYQKAVTASTFKTPVGYSFMSDLANMIKAKDETVVLPPINVNGLCIPRNSYEYKNTINKITQSDAKDKKQKIRNHLYWSMVLNFILAILVAAMFYVATSGSNINILNYKKIITNEYADWEQQLTEWEKDLNNREKEINQR